MTTYKGINGFAVQSLASDPSPLDEGQVWYNNTSYAFKLAAITTNSWATATSLPSIRASQLSFGSRSAGVTAGGSDGSANVLTTFNYNGTSWTSSGSMNSGRVNSGGGVGTQTSSIIAGGYSGAPGEPPAGTNVTESYNGSSWSTSPNINTRSWVSSTFGASGTAATYVAGYNGAGAGVQAVENYNGSSWTATGNMNASRGYTQSAGTQTAGVSFGGYRWSTFGQPAPGGAQNLTENFNGSSWTTAPNMPVAVYSHGGSAGGTQTAALAFGGASTNPAATTVSYNGSSWTAVGNLNTGRSGAGGAGFGTNTAGIVAGGNAPTESSSVEHYNASAVGTKTITTS
jgi:hypothetical protein